MSKKPAEKSYSLEILQKTSEMSPSLVDQLSKIKRGQSKRADGRSLDECRPLYLKADIAGSAYAEQGNTKVHCTVKPPHEIERNLLDSISEPTARALLTVRVIYAPFAYRSRLARSRSDQETPEERTCRLALTDAFSSVVILEKYQFSQIDLLVTVLEDDGGVLALALTACSVALATSGIEIYDLVIGSSVAVIEEQLLIDPTMDEQKLMESDTEKRSKMEVAQLTFGLMPSLNQSVAFLQTGQMRPKDFSGVLSALTELCYRLYPRAQNAVSKSVRLQSHPAAVVDRPT